MAKRPLLSLILTLAFASAPLGNQALADELTTQIEAAKLERRAGVQELIGAGVSLNLGIAALVLGFVFQSVERTGKAIGTGIGNSIGTAFGSMTTVQPDTSTSPAWTVMKVGGALLGATAIALVVDGALKIKRSRTFLNQVSLGLAPTKDGAQAGLLMRF